MSAITTRRRPLAVPEVTPAAADTRDCRPPFTAEIFGPGDNRTGVLMSAPPEPE